MFLLRQNRQRNAAWVIGLLVALTAVWTLSSPARATVPQDGIVTGVVEKLIRTDPVPLEELAQFDSSDLYVGGIFESDFSRVSVAGVLFLDPEDISSQLLQDLGVQTTAQLLLECPHCVSHRLALLVSHDDRVLAIALFDPEAVPLPGDVMLSTDLGADWVAFVSHELFEHMYDLIHEVYYPLRDTNADEDDNWNPGDW